MTAAAQEIHRVKRNQLGLSLRVAAINLQRLLTLGLGYDNGLKIA